MPAYRDDFACPACVRHYAPLGPRGTPIYRTPKPTSSFDFRCAACLGIPNSPPPPPVTWEWWGLTVWSTPLPTPPAWEWWGTTIFSGEPTPPPPTPAFYGTAATFGFWET